MSNSLTRNGIFSQQPTSTKNKLIKVKRLFNYATNGLKSMRLTPPQNSLHWTLLIFCGIFILLSLPVRLRCCPFCSLFALENVIILQSLIFFLSNLLYILNFSRENFFSKQRSFHFFLSLLTTQSFSIDALILFIIYIKISSKSISKLLLSAECIFILLLHHFVSKNGIEFTLPCSVDKFFMHKCRYQHSHQFTNEWFIDEAKMFEGNFSHNGHIIKFNEFWKQIPQTSKEHDNKEEKKILFNRCLHRIILNGAELVAHNDRLLLWTRLDVFFMRYSSFFFPRLPLLFMGGPLKNINANNLYLFEVFLFFTTAKATGKITRMTSLRKMYKIEFHMNSSISGSSWWQANEWMSVRGQASLNCGYLLNTAQTCNWFFVLLD